MAPTLTRRGRAVAWIAAVALLLAWGFGPRSLNAVVMPAVALLAVSAATIWRVDRPHVTRRAPSHGHVDATRTVELQVEADGSYALTVEDAVPRGLDADAELATVSDGRILRYDLRLARRGVHTLGPIRVTARDPFGLWEREFSYSDTDTVVVFPPIRPLAETATLLRDYVGITDERGQFDSLRGYERGDALRDVNWKASAKRESGDLYVTEFAGRGSTDRVTIAAEAESHRADSVAEATASVAAFLLDAGLAVGVVTPQGRIDPAKGDEHRRRLLSLLARLEPGPLRSRHRRNADVVVRAPPDGAHVDIAVEGGVHRFTELVDGAAEATTGREVVA